MCTFPRVRSVSTCSLLALPTHPGHGLQGEGQHRAGKGLAWAGSGSPLNIQGWGWPGRTGRGAAALKMSKKAVKQEKRLHVIPHC